MKKYLLLATYSIYDRDDEDLVLRNQTLGTFDSVKDAIESARKDLEENAIDLAEARFDKDEELEEYNDYIKDYMSYITLPKITENNFSTVGAVSVILNHEYDTDYWTEQSKYTLIRLV